MESGETMSVKFGPTRRTFLAASAGEPVVAAMPVKVMSAVKATASALRGRRALRLGAGSVLLAVWADMFGSYEKAVDLTGCGGTFAKHLDYVAWVGTI